MDLHFFYFFVTLRQDEFGILSKSTVELFYNIALLKVGVLRIIEKLNRSITLLCDCLELMDELSKMSNWW
jgi:hypothetical protein